MIRLPPQQERAWTRRTAEDMARENAAMDAEVERELEKWFANMRRISPVSYTHLTLPTKA